MKNMIKISLMLLGNIVFGLSYAQSNYSYSYENHPPTYYQNDYYRDQQNQTDYRYSNQGNPYSSPNQKFYSGDSPQMFDWDYRESWRDQRQSFYGGETQAEAYRKAHPYGKPGIGYDGDPTYLRMESEYKRLKEESNHDLAENNRIASREPNQNQEYYSRGGGGASQKGKASRESREKNSNQQDFNQNYYRH